MILKNKNKWTITAWTFVFIVLFTQFAVAQTIRITGKIIDSVTLKPIANASINIVNSTIGTKTDENGNYEFSKLAAGTHDLIVSCLGYNAKQAEIPAGTEDRIVNIALGPKSTLLNEVTIHSINDWKHNLSLFKREFIGTNDAGECKVVNPEILNLDFDYKNNRLTASTDEFLDIENSMLGYELRFLIKDFSADYNTRKCHYSGNVIFDTLKGTKKEHKKWAKNRLETYEGSFRHFLTALSSGQTGKEKFIIRKLNRVPNPNRPDDELIKLKINALMNKPGRHPIDSLEKWRQLSRLKKIVETLDKQPVNVSDIMHPAVQQGTFNLQFDGYLYVIYKGNTVNGDIDDLFRFPEARDFQTSALSLKNPRQPIVFNSDGVLLTKDDLFYEGAWTSRILYLLPSDYMPEQK
jgi:hypothetical protein